MDKFVKLARSKESMRGYFSYITESVINLMGLMYKHDRDIIYYHDLTNIPGYGHYNLFDVGFEQTQEDYINNKNEYLNIENACNRLFDPYELENLDEGLRFFILFY
jgi:hypothetical protein